MRPAKISPATKLFHGRAVPGFMGLTCDHIFENCLALRKRKAVPLSSRLYPEDDPYGDICGICKNRYEALSESEKDWLAK